MSFSKQFVRVAVPIPLYRLFDYVVDTEVVDTHQAQVGSRVIVPFGNRKLVGIVVSFCSELELDVDPQKLKKLDTILDQELLSQQHIDLANWVASYYLAPIGMIYELILPVHLRKGDLLTPKGDNFWQVIKMDSDDPKSSGDQFGRAHAQRKLFNFLNEENGASTAQLENNVGNWRSTMKALMQRGLVEKTQKLSFSEYATIESDQSLTLNLEQQTIVDSIQPNGFAAHLIHGITGSGKTEVYLSIVEKVLNQAGSDRQALLLVPEISLTPQFVDRVRKRLKKSVAVMHSALNDRQRHKAWWSARAGKVDIVLGTRASVFTPFKNLGIIIVDEEHDASFKQQDGVRYHARDVATVRAKQSDIPIIMGSATPSFESLYNVELGKFTLSTLKQRATGMLMPDMKLIDVSDPAQKAVDGLSPRLVQEIEKRLAAKQQTILFINRRGFSPTLYCTECGWIAGCPRCDARLTAHINSKTGLIHLVRCHHCGYESKCYERQVYEKKGQQIKHRIDNHDIQTCGSCQQQTVMPMGAGTQRTEEALKQRFPSVNIARLDRDAITTKNALENELARIRSNEVDIILGTQMLTKGHDFPNVTLVGILDADQGLFSIDFRGLEKLYQQLLQVSGRAGRHQAGEVYIQTKFPNHSFFEQLMQQDYDSFAHDEIQSRKLLAYPPMGHLALLRVESTYAKQGLNFLRWCRQQITTTPITTTPITTMPSVFVSDAVAAPMEKRAGRYRAQLLMQSASRQDLQKFQRQLLAVILQSKQQSQIRWSIDIDPIDLY